MTRYVMFAARETGKIAEKQNWSRKRRWRQDGKR